MSQLKLLAGATALVLAAGAANAASSFVQGSTFTVDATNSPVTGLSLATLTPGVIQTVASGLLHLEVLDTPVAGGGEWLVFIYGAQGGVTLSQPTQNWALNEVGLQASVGVTLAQAFVAFADFSGTALAPTASIFSNFTVGTSPVPGFTYPGFVSGITNTQFAAGPLPSLGTFIDPFSHISAAGIDPTVVASYLEALLFLPTNPVTPPGVPEPSAIAVLLAGVIGLAGARKFL